MHKLSLLAVFFSFSTALLAVEYELPNEDGIDQVQLQAIPSYETVCDSANDTICDVNPGQYQLVIFRDNWDDVERQVIDIVDDASGSGFTTAVAVNVEEPQPGDAAGANVECPVGTKVIGVLTCTSIWREKEYPNAVVIQASTGFGSDNSISGCFHLVDANDPYETYELITTIKVACLAN